MNSLGSWAFLIGIVLAVVLSVVGAAGAQSWLGLVLAVLGLIVGLFNITTRETTPFLVASIAFLISFASLQGIVGVIPWVGASVSLFFQLMAIFIAPAAAIVAFVSVLLAARS